jgi:hypothetical protein
MNAVIIEGAEGIKFAQMAARRGALRLEIAGMKLRGRSAYSICKSEYGLKGSREKVLEQMTELIEAAKAAKREGATPNED